MNYNSIYLCAHFNNASVAGDKLLRWDAECWGLKFQLYHGDDDDGDGDDGSDCDYDDVDDDGDDAGSDGKWQMQTWMQGNLKMFFCRLKFVLKLINHSCAKPCSTHTPASLTKWLKIIFLSPNKKRKERKRVFHLQYWEVITREKDGRQIQSLERHSGTICEQTKDYNPSLFTKL